MKRETEGVNGARPSCTSRKYLANLDRVYSCLLNSEIRGIGPVMCDFRVESDKIEEVLPRVGKTCRDSSGIPAKHVFRSVTNLTGYRGTVFYEPPSTSPNRETSDARACIWIIVDDRDPRRRENRFEIPCTVTYGVSGTFSSRQTRVCSRYFPFKLFFFSWKILT